MSPVQDFWGVTGTTVVVEEDSSTIEKSEYLVRIKANKEAE